MKLDILTHWSNRMSQTHFFEIIINFSDLLQLESSKNQKKRWSKEVGRKTGSIAWQF